MEIGELPDGAADTNLHMTEKLRGDHNFVQVYSGHSRPGKVIEQPSRAAEYDYLNSISYRDFLGRHLNIQEPEIFTVFENLVTDWCVGIEAVPAIEAFYWGMPGINATSFGGDTGWARSSAEATPAYHFPDGNASVARMLVRSLIPDVAPGTTIEDVVLAPFDYSKLDVAASNARVRLNSTVVHVQHDGAPQSASRVGVTYVRGGQADRVWARHCVLACYQVIPHLCPELPEAQREALGTMVKSPMRATCWGTASRPAGCRCR